MARVRNRIKSTLREYRFESIIVKIFLMVFISCMIPFLLLGALYYHSNKTTVYNNIDAENSFILKEACDLTESVLNECDMLCTYIANRDIVQMFMINDWYVDRNGSALSDLNEFISSLPRIYNYIDSIYIYSEYNNRIYSGKMSGIEEFKDTGWRETYDLIDNIRGTIVTRKKNNVYPNLITIIKPAIIDDEKTGAVILNINSTHIFDMLPVVRDSNLQGVYLIDDVGQIFMSHKDDDFEHNISELYPGILPGLEETSVIKDAQGKKYMVSASDMDYFGLKYIRTSSMTDYYANLHKVQLQMLLLLLIVLILSIVISIIISLNVYKPMEEIISVIDDPEHYTFDERRRNELRYVIINILQHIRDKSEMRQELNSRIEMLNRAQVMMLQAQINPHFLYNTLDTIKWMAIDLTGTKNKASVAITALARLMRFSVDSNDYIISIDRELEYTKNYIEILDMRYPDMIAIKWDIDEEVYNYSTIKICFQPIIENAVYHGLKKNGGGTIIINGRTYDDYIVFEIIDDGAGMSTEQINGLNDAFNDHNYVTEGHIGLRNVNKRIKIIFGDEYGLYVTKNETGGTIVGLVLPKKKQTDLNFD